MSESHHLEPTPTDVQPSALDAQDLPHDETVTRNLAQVAQRWIVLSGKGGVGKSTIAVNLAAALAAEGKTVGLLDVDLHGPDVVKMLGLEGRQLGGGMKGIEPLRPQPNLRVVSMASLLRSPDQAVTWRGHRKTTLIRQFLGEVAWGKLDHLVVDCPPGTGDEPLTVVQLIGKVDGAIIVTTPQAVALLDSRKCITFARMAGMPIAGIVENMSGMTCPHCGGEMEPFDIGGGEIAAQELNVPFLGRLPLVQGIRESGDRGVPFVNNRQAVDSDTRASMAAIVHAIVSEHHG